MNSNRAAPGCRSFLATLVCFFLAQPGALYAGAQEQEPQETEEQEERTEETQEPADIIPRFTDQVVVSASRVEQEIVNAPAAIAVISSEVIETQAPATSGICCARPRGST